MIAATLDPTVTLIDTLQYTMGISDRATMRVLNRFAFTYHQERCAGDLSGGNRSRLLLVSIVLSGARFWARRTTQTSRDASPTGTSSPPSGSRASTVCAPSVIPVPRLLRLGHRLQEA